MTQKSIEELTALTWPDGRPKIAPVQGYVQGIPWSLHLRAYNVYCKRHGKQDALIDLEGRGCRGGFGTSELDDFVPGWRTEVEEIYQLRTEVERLRAATPAAGMVEADRNRLADILWARGMTHGDIRERSGWLLASCVVRRGRELTEQEMLANIFRAVDEPDEALASTPKASDHPPARAESEVITLPRSVIMDAREHLKSYIAGSEDSTEEQETEGRTALANLDKALGERPTHEYWKTGEVVPLSPPQPDRNTGEAKSYLLVDFSRALRKAIGANKGCGDLTCALAASVSECSCYRTHLFLMTHVEAELNALTSSAPTQTEEEK